METKENYTSNNALVKLPREIIHEILKYVPESTVINLVMTCMGMNEILKPEIERIKIQEEIKRKNKIRIQNEKKREFRAKINWAILGISFISI
jgi:quinolinate synthase